jgi:hypothetical protein
MLKRSKSYSPEREFRIEVTPKPKRKFIRGPEKIPATAVEVYPLLAKAVMER